MAKCSKCGRELPVLRFGRQRDVCQWCRQYEAAQRGEDTSEYQPVIRQPWRRTSHDPFVTYLILGLNVAVFIGMALAGISPMNPGIQELVHWGANFGPLTLSGDWWRLFSCMFLHIGFIHIAFNMWCLWDLGVLAESLYGSWTFAAIYLISGVASSLASVWIHPRTVSAGASGAIFGIVGALIASLKLGEFSLPRTAIQGVLRSVVIFAAYALIFGAISARTDNAAHVGGLVCGLLLGAAVAKLAPSAYQPVRRVGVLALVALLVWGAGGWLFKSRSYVAQVARAERMLEQGGHDDEAIAQLNKALAARPDDAHARYSLALAYARKGQLEQAERHFKYLAEKHPDSALARYNLGLVYLDSGRPEDAKREFSAVVAADKGSADAHQGLGLALAELGDIPAALGEFKMAVDLDPELAQANYNLGTAYLRLKQYDDAQAAFKKSLEVDGDQARTFTALAQVYRAKGMADEAKGAEARAAQLEKK